MESYFLKGKEKRSGAEDEEVGELSFAGGAEVIVAVEIAGSLESKSSGYQGRFEPEPALSATKHRIDKEYC
jgi:hypothetical protein